jgi:hypothetical protein
MYVLDAPKPRESFESPARLSGLMTYHCEAFRPMVTGLPKLITAAI